MCSRFTEIFDFNKTWENSQSDSSLPLSWESRDTFFSSSTVTLDTPREETIDSFSDFNTKMASKNSLCTYQSQLCTPLYSTDDEASRSSKLQLKSKLKRFLTTIGNCRRQEKST